VTQREHLHCQVMDALYCLADARLQRGRYGEAQRYARRQIELEPWREEAHRQLMRALALSGQRSRRAVAIRDLPPHFGGRDGVCACARHRVAL